MARSVRNFLSALPFRKKNISPSTDEETIHPDPEISRIDEETIHPDPEISSRTEERLRLDPAQVKEHFDRIGHFRILVIGRSNAGKTTLLQRVCNTTELPEIFNANGEKIDPANVQGSLERGLHNIEDELIFQSNQGFIFHDSRGFETGSVNELNLMKDFVADRAATMELGKRIHVIWYCLSMADHERPILAAEEKFFNECNTRNVPVIAVLTKADALKVPALNQQMREKGLSMKEAMPRAEEMAAQMLIRLRARIESQLGVCKYPPKAYLELASMNKEGADCGPLLRCTVDALDEVELQKLVISTQQVNIDLNIEYAVKSTLKSYMVLGEFEKLPMELGTLSWMPYKLYRRERYRRYYRREREREGRYYFRREQQNQDQKLINAHCFNIDSLSIPLMCPLSIVSPKDKSIIHGTGCILIFEYIYFLLQTNEDTGNALNLGVKEYERSGTQAAVLNALQYVIQQHGNDHDALTSAITKIIFNHRMSKKFLEQ